MNYSKPDGLYFFLASELDANHLHAEVYYNNLFICQVDTELGNFRVSLFNDPRINPSQETVSVNLQDFIMILDRAKEELKKFPNGLP